MNGKTDAAQWIRSEYHLEEWMLDEDAFEDAMAAAKVALLHKCDNCGRRTEGHCCAEMPLEGEWSLL